MKAKVTLAGTGVSQFKQNMANFKSQGGVSSFKRLFTSAKAEVITESQTSLESETKQLTDGGRGNQKLLTERSSVPSETGFVGDENGGLSTGRGNANTVGKIPQPIQIQGEIEVPGRVQSRINLKTGDARSGWKHVLKEHFNPDKNKSQFTVKPDELQQILQSKDAVKTPVTRTLESADGVRYVRELDVSKQIGVDKFNGYNPTSIMSILTDKYGNLITATPGVIK